MKLNLFDSTGIDETKLHPKFKLLRDQPTLYGEREIVENWTDNFIDRDNKIVLEFQTTFHSTFWEFFLYRLLIEAGFTIDFSHDRPDFIITAPYEIYIEAVVAEIKKDGAKEAQRTLDDILSMCNPPHLQTDFKELIDEAIVRNSNAILSKSKKYLNSYSDLSWINPTFPFVVAMCSFDQINYGREYYYAMLALLFGKYYNPVTRYFDDIISIMKPNTDSEIPVGLFNDDSFSHISAIIFTCTLTFGKLTSLFNSSTNSERQLNKFVNVRHDTEEPFYKIHIVSQEVPEELSDGLFIFHNPNAKNKLPEDFLNQTNIIQLHANDHGCSLVGENAPIVSRLNLSKFTFLNKSINEIFNKYNS